MKKLIHGAVIIGIAFCTYGQGEIALDNLSNTSSDPFVTSNGLFWISSNGIPTLINQDFNAAFYGGANSNTLSPIAIFLLSDGTANSDNVIRPGTFVDPTGKPYPIADTSISAFFQIQAWTGTFNSYAAAVSGGAFAGQSSVFINPVSIPPGTAPDLVGMPAIVLSSVPEPSTLALCLLGALSSLPSVRRWGAAGFRRLAKAKEA